MQARGGRGYGASLPRIDGLIALAVGGFVGALDVGRQRDVAEPAERFVETRFRSEAQDAQAIIAAAFGDGFQFTFSITENDFFAYGNFSAGAHESFPGVGCELADEQNFDDGLQVLVASWVVDAGRFGVNAHAAAEQACREDASVVEHDEFIAVQQVGKFLEMAVVPRPGGFVEE